MSNMRTVYLATAGFALAAIAVAPLQLDAQPAPATNAVAVDADDIGGVVTGARGPEAGVWVIAETRDLPTRFIRIVVTDDQGRFLIPDLPKANYSIWVRGYGLVDSAKVQSQPGKTLALKAAAAPSKAAAAEYYPAIYWYTMLEIPDAKLFPGTGPSGNGMPVALKDQAQWLRYLKTDGCNGCHQVGGKLTRTFPKELGHFDNASEAWERRLQSGQASGFMVNNIGNLDAGRALKYFGDWTDNVAKGALPDQAPARPSGKERNIVITLWDWSTPSTYLHDEIATDRRNPTVNGYGLIYGSAEESSDFIPVLDPKTHTASLLKSEWRDPKTPTTKNHVQYAPSPYWGSEAVWDSHTTIHNPMFDEKGQVWFTARIRPPQNPDFCKAGSNHPSAKAFPLATSGRQLEVYDPKTKKFTLIDTCFTTHHLQFDANNVIWFSGQQSPVASWFDRDMFERTHDNVASQGWSPFIIDTNGNGKRDAWVEPGQPADPTKDTRFGGPGFYGVSPNPADGTIWGSAQGFPGWVIHFDPKTQLSEVFEVPWKDPKTNFNGFSPRGMDIDLNGVVWTVLSSGHLASFDRKLCKGPLNGPAAATGKQCPEGWRMYALPGPQFKNVAHTGGSAESPYYDWVDQHDTLGLGRNVPVATGNQSDALFALVDGKFVTLRVPYPMGFYAKGLDGRIDDAKAGWKGRGLWSTYSTRAPQHTEGGKGQTSKVVHFQIRPDPLAK